MEAEDTLGTLTALANETRLKVYRVLAGAGDEGMKAKDIATEVEVPPTSLSAHLAILARAGVVTLQKRGTAKIYRAQPDRIKALAKLLVDG